MPVLTFYPSGQTNEVPQGTNLMKAILKAGLPIGASCDSIGVCGKCHVKVLEGEENLSPAGPIELKLLIRENVPQGGRMSCLTKVLGPLKITTTYW